MDNSFKNDCLWISSIPLSESKCVIKKTPKFLLSTLFFSHLRIAAYLLFVLFSPKAIWSAKFFFLPFFWVDFKNPFTLEICELKEFHYVHVSRPIYQNFA